MKAIYVVLGVAAVGGAIWWFKNKNSGVPSPVPAPDASGVIPPPASEVEATKIIKLPDTLLQNTSGNTGILPPVLSTSQNSAPITQPPPVKVTKPIATTNVKVSTILPSKLTALRGLGQAYLMN